MSREEILAFLRILWENPQSAESDLLQKDLGFDSLGMVGLLLGLEDTFGFELKESDMNPFDLRSVSDVIDLVLRYRGEDDGKSS